MTGLWSALEPPLFYYDQSILFRAVIVTNILKRFIVSTILKFYQRVLTDIDFINSENAVEKSTQVFISEDSMTFPMWKIHFYQEAWPLRVKSLRNLSGLVNFCVMQLGQQTHPEVCACIWGSCSSKHKCVQWNCQKCLAYLENYVTFSFFEHDDADYHQQRQS